MTEQSIAEARAELRTLREALAGERSRAEALEAELASLKDGAAGHLGDRPGPRPVDMLYARAAERLREAMRFQPFETLRAVVPPETAYIGRRWIEVPWRKVTAASIVYISACEAFAATLSSDPPDYVGRAGSAEIVAHNVVCSEGRAQVDLEIRAAAPTAVLVNLTLLGAPEAYAFANVRDQVSAVADETTERRRAQIILNLSGLDGDDTSFVGSVYRRFLRREADQAGLDHYVALLCDDPGARAAILAQVLASEEYAARHGAQHPYPQIAVALRRAEDEE